jgi:hypothetical protein
MRRVPHLSAAATVRCHRCLTLLLDVAGRPAPADNVEHIENIIIRIDAEQNTDG